ncbi:MAG: 3-dehydroquinate synthase [Candidatus Binatia bacterium]|nr:3-dehydroquinate synthase [Candidatus Binatia bacterium]
MREIEQSFSVSYRYPVVFTRGAFNEGNSALRDALLRAGEGPHRVLVVIDSNVLAATPELPGRLAAYAAANPALLEPILEPYVLRGGEGCKEDLSWLPEIHSRIAERGICRHSFVFAIGGGSVLDAAGYAAALAHRGVRLIRFPTTVLAQNDAGIGVKNAVNFQQRKNFVGTFVPPFAVVNDFDFLSTLDPRDMRSGAAEAVKVALIKDSEFFGKLHAGREDLGRFEPKLMEDMIVRCAELHLEHIRTSGDPFELGSARPLDFGHWAAHKLEELSGYDLRHGEAVAIGIALDSSYCARRGMISQAACDRIFETLEAIGFGLSHSSLAVLDIKAALDDFRVHLGGELCICLLEGIGRSVDVGSIDIHEMQRCVDLLHDRG